MKIIRGGLFIISVIVLFLSLLLANVFFSISWSISYDEISTELSQTISEILEKEYDLNNYIEKNEEEIYNYCLPHQEYEFDFEGIKKNLSCEKIILGMEKTIDEIITHYENKTQEITKKVVEEHKEMKNYCIENENFYLTKLKKNISCESTKEGKEKIIEHIVKEYAQEVYYEDYEKCNFWDCLEKTSSTQFLISQKAKDYWKAKARTLILISFISTIVLFFLIDNRYNFPIALGATIILSGLPLLKIDSIVATLTKPFLKGLEFINYQDTNSIKSILGIFFYKSTDLFYILFLIGTIILISGVILRFWTFFTGRDKKLFSKKEVSEMIQKELKSKKK